MPLAASRRSTVLASLVCKESDAELIHDIEVMEDEAKHRLQSLMEQMDELQAFQQQSSSTTTTTTTTISAPQEHQCAPPTEHHPDPRIMINDKLASIRIDSDEKTTKNLSAPSLSGPETKAQDDKEHLPKQQESMSSSLPPSSSNQQEEQRRKSLTRTAAPPSRQQPHQQQQTPQKRQEVAIVRPRELGLLADTSWKIVLNIGREEGTWMPPQWGKSGGRLRVEVHCTFSDAVVKVQNNKDPFFAHSAEPVRYIQIEEAFVWPTNVGVGRRPLTINPNAGQYQICPGIGPSGTDLLRLMIPIPDDLQKDDVTLNAGRVYGTTGYFGRPDEGRQQIMYAVQDEYDHCLTECTKLQRELTETENVIDWCRVRHAVWTADRALDRAMARVTLAGQHYPDHAHMRTDPTGRVGLAKEGGLCVSVHTGLAMEYHILGRMEVGHLKLEKK